MRLRIGCDTQVLRALCLLKHSNLMWPSLTAKTSKKMLFLFARFHVALFYYSTAKRRLRSTGLFWRGWRRLGGAGGGESGYVLGGSEAVGQMSVYVRTRWREFW